jgi:uncharacterized membrane protein YkvA (DUF1232 family)
VIRRRIDRLRDWAARLREEVRTLAGALGDSRTPRHAQVVLALTVGLTVSPIDPIPDFVPVLGYVDDLLFVPVGVWLSRRLTPDEVLADARERVREGEGGRLGWLVAALLILGYVALGVLAFVVFVR